MRTPQTPHARGTCSVVADVMLRRPKVLGATATVGDAQAVLADAHVHLVLVVDGDRLVGTVTRPDLAEAPVGAPVRSVATLAERTVEPSADAEQVRGLMVSTGLRRLAVVDDGALVGLLCLKRTGRGFCSDRDVAARAASRASAPSAGQCE